MLLEEEESTIFEEPTKRRKERERESAGKCLCVGVFSTAVKATEQHSPVIMYRCARRGLQEIGGESRRGGDLELLDYGGLPSDLMTDNFLSAFIM